MHIRALLEEVHSRYVVGRTAVGNADIHVCNYSYRREIEGIPTLAYLCSVLPFATVRPGRSLGFKVCVQCREMPSYRGNATVTFVTKKRRVAKGKGGHAVSALHGMKIVSPHTREVVMYAMQQVFEMLSDLQHPETGARVAFTIRASPPQIVCVLFPPYRTPNHSHSLSSRLM